MLLLMLVRIFAYVGNRRINDRLSDHSEAVLAFQVCYLENAHVALLLWSGSTLWCVSAREKMGKKRKWRGR